MADWTIWHLFTGTNASKTAAPLAQLASAGCQLQPWRSPGRNGEYGIVFFEEATAEVRDALQETSCGGLRRVLAISVEDRPLAAKDVQSLLQCGAWDYLCWPSPADLTAEIIPRIERWREIDDIVQSPLVQENLVGGSREWMRVLREIVELARFTTAPALITGESGTGKELAARLIHALSPDRRDKELVVVDCTTIVSELSGSELFGHERGAYTGAAGPRTGAFELAHGGTLFLDEVGELPLPLQAQLLRAIQEHTYKRVGGNEWRTADFRLVCATNRPLLEDVKDGRFRSDLYYRIAAGTFKLPCLRERPDDILPLARHFLRTLRPDCPALDFSDSVKQWLITREYPGNIRDLKQTITRIGYRHVGPGLISFGDVPPSERDGGVDTSDWADGSFERAIRHAVALGTELKEISRKSAEIAIRVAIEEANGNLPRAARQLGVTDRALQLRRARGNGDFRAAG
jgi:transcriptional regulator with GAF, ATPase, and Fis domain